MQRSINSRKRGAEMVPVGDFYNLRSGKKPRIAPAGQVGKTATLKKRNRTVRGGNHTAAELIYAVGHAVGPARLIDYGNGFQPQPAILLNANVSTKIRSAILAQRQQTAESERLERENDYLNDVLRILQRNSLVVSAESQRLFGLRRPFAEEATFLKLEKMILMMLQNSRAFRTALTNVAERLRQSDRSLATLRSRLDSTRPQRQAIMALDRIYMQGGLVEPAPAPEQDRIVCPIDEDLLRENILAFLYNITNANAEYASSFDLPDYEDFAGLILEDPAPCSPASDSLPPNSPFPYSPFPDGTFFNSPPPNSPTDSPSPVRPAPNIILAAYEDDRDARDAERLAIVLATYARDLSTKFSDFKALLALSPLPHRNEQDQANFAFQHAGAELTEAIENARRNGFLVDAHGHLCILTSTRALRDWWMTAFHARSRARALSSLKVLRPLRTWGLVPDGRLPRELPRPSP